MQYSVAILALVASASAGYLNTTAPVYTTEVVTAYTTYCPAPTEITHGGVTYTVTEATTLTITDCPCTIVKPVTTSAPVPTTAPVYVNSTVPAGPPATTEVGTTYVPGPSASATPSQIEANSGNKAIAFSGASLAGLLGLAAYIL